MVSQLCLIAIIVTNVKPEPYSDFYYSAFWELHLSTYKYISSSDTTEELLWCVIKTLYKTHLSMIL